MIFLAKIKNKELDFGSESNLARWHEFLKNNEGKVIQIDKQRPIRTLTQNAFYWAWLEKVELETGNQSEDMHEYGKATFLPKRLIKVKGKHGEYTVQTLGSTTKLNKLEFGEYLDKFSAHVEIPLPSIEEIKAMGYLK